MHAIRRTSLIALALAAFACSSEPGNSKVDIGDREVEVLGEKLSDFSGEWDGYLEAFNDQGTDTERIRISLDANGNGAVKFGDADVAPPLSSNPLDTYPVDPVFGQEAGVLPVAGYEYTLSETSLQDRRFRFDFQLEQPMGPWCAQQSPLPAKDNFPGWYSCSWLSGDELPQTCTVLDPQSGEEVPIACSAGVVQACHQACHCDAEACEAVARAPIHFDGALEENGQRFAGTLLFHQSPFYAPDTRVTVRLARVTE